MCFFSETGFSEDLQKFDIGQDLRNRSERNDLMTGMVSGLVGLRIMGAAA